MERQIKFTHTNSLCVLLALSAGQRDSWASNLLVCRCLSFEVSPNELMSSQSRRTGQRLWLYNFFCSDCRKLLQLTAMCSGTDFGSYPKFRCHIVEVSFERDFSSKTGPAFWRNYAHESLSGGEYCLLSSDKTQKDLKIQIEFCTSNAFISQKLVQRPARSKILRTDSFCVTGCSKVYRRGLPYIEQRPQFAIRFGETAHLQFGQKSTGTFRLWKKTVEAASSAIVLQAALCAWLFVWRLVNSVNWTLLTESGS